MVCANNTPMGTMWDFFTIDKRKKKLMNTLITIDLDYWTNCYKHTNKSAIKLLKEIKKAASKSVMIWEHHYILDVIPKNTERVINIDFHNDIIGENSDGDDVVNEGTWGNYLPKSVERFDWYYPSHNRCIEEAAGLCLDSNGEVSTNYPVDYTETRDWRKMSFDQATTFVLCVSPQWAHEHEYIDYLTALNIDDDITNDVIKF